MSLHLVLLFEEVKNYLKCNKFDTKKTRQLKLIKKNPIN